MLLGQAREANSELEDAIEAYEGVRGRWVEDVTPTLVRLYEKEGEWRKLVALYERRVTTTRDVYDRADMYHRMGVLWQHHLVDEERAGDSYSLALKSNPDHVEAQLAYGLLLYNRNQFDLALPLLARRIDVHDTSTPTTQLVALSECYRQTQSFERALEVTAEVLRREPTRHELIATRAEMQEALVRPTEAAAEWRRYLEALGPGGESFLVVQTRRRLAALARAQNNLQEAVTELTEAYRLAPENVDLIVELRGLCEGTGRWQEAVELRVREASAAEEPESRAAHYKTAAGLLLTRLNDAARAAVMMERASEACPNDVALLKSLLSLYEEQGDKRKFLVMGERILANTGGDGLDAAFFVKLARAYLEAAEDAERAKEFYAKALERAPDDDAILEDFGAFARAQGDWALFVEIEEKIIARLDDDRDRTSRLRELAEVCLKELRSLDEATRILNVALGIAPHDRELLRTLANTYALDAKSYGQAAETYRRLLEEDPLDASTLRILARLYGQMGENDRAYGLYAGLLALSPTDEEARRFVTACRPAVPAGPQRPLNDNDRVQGLIHPEQGGAVEELFAPLARFAELTHPTTLTALGITERDRLPAAEATAQWLKRVLEPMGVGQAALFVRKGGGFEARAELLGAPTIVLGEALMVQGNERQKAFMVARAGELFRTGHTLVERLSSPELTALVGALCLAVKPDSNPPGGHEQTPLWANTVAAPMTESIRTSLASRAQAYLEAAASVDFGRWKWGSVLTATRVALLVACDVEDAIGALLKSRGVDDLGDDQRIAVVRELPDALDLMRFATSETYFKMRQSLGLALRRSK